MFFMYNMERSRFESNPNPFFHRYLPKDEELAKAMGEPVEGGLYEVIKTVTGDLLIPRLCAIREALSELAATNQGKKIPRRIDGIRDGEISIEEYLGGFAKGLESREESIRHALDRLQEAESESFRNYRMADLCHYSLCAFAVMANVANDIRHLFRSEIWEVDFIDYGDTRIGSSTMPHKRNPAEWERIVSLWKAYHVRQVAILNGQVIEHQGDSTNDYVQEEALEIVAATTWVARSLRNNLGNLRFDV